MAEQGELNPKLYDFIDSSMYYEVHENYEDLVEDKLFKYKYRQMADDNETFGRRMLRVMEKFYERKEKNQDHYVDIEDVFKRD